MGMPRRADRITSVLLGAEPRFLNKWLCLSDGRQVYDLPPIWVAEPLGWWCNFSTSKIGGHQL